MGRKASSRRRLPEELVEKIIAMVPFPSIFKARLLSKSWYYRFEPASQLLNEEDKRLAATFQKRVTESSNNWGIFCPLCTNEEDPFVYNQAMRKWQRPPSLSVPFVKVQKRFPNWLNLRGKFSRYEAVNYQLEGPLLYGSWLHDGIMQQTHVRNILTGECKKLPDFPEVGAIIVHCMKLVIDPAAETYKVIVVCQEFGDERHDDEFKRYSAHTYDSKSDIWSSKEFAHLVDFDLSLFDYTYFNGVLYMLLLDIYAVYCDLLAFNVEEGSLEELRLSLSHDEELNEVKLVVCNSDLMMIVIDTDGVRVLRIDLVSLQALPVALCHANTSLEVVNTREMISARICEVNRQFFKANCLFFENEDNQLVECNRIVEYNKSTDKWDFFLSMVGCHWSECSFEPWLNPFIAV